MDGGSIPINVTAVRLKQLELLHVVAESGSISAAARYLNISSSAANEMLRCLERAFDTRLFVGDSKGVMLTGEGRRVARRATLMLRELNLAVDEAGELADQSEELRVGVAPLMLLTGFAEALQLLQYRYPQLHVRLRQTDAAEAMSALRDGEIDVAVTANNPSLMSPDARGALSVQTIAEDRWTLFVSALVDLPESWTPTPFNIRALPWVFPVRQSPMRRVLEDWFLARGLAPPEPQMELMGVGSATELMKRIPCAILLPSNLARSGNFPQLRLVPDCDFSLPLSIAVAASERQLRRPPVDAFVQEITARFSIT